MDTDNTCFDMKKDRIDDVVGSGEKTIINYDVEKPSVQDVSFIGNSLQPIIMPKGIITLEDKESMRYATLFSQLAANAKANESQDPHKWYLSFISKLQICGWFQQHFSEKNFSLGKSTVNVKDLVLKSIAAYFVGGAATQIPKIIETIIQETLAPNNSGKTKVFSSSSRKGSSLALRVAPITLDESNVPVITCIGILTSVTQTHKNFWLMEVDKSKAKFKTFCYIGRLARNAFDDVKDVIALKTKKFRTSEIEVMELKQGDS